MNHLGEGQSHEAKHRCRYSLQYDNRIYTCKVGLPLRLLLQPSCNTWSQVFDFACTVLTNEWNTSFQACYEGGKEVIVVPKTSASSDSPWLGLAKYAWSG